MPLGQDDLVLCSGTLPRGVAWRERIEAAAAAASRASRCGEGTTGGRGEEGFDDADIASLLHDFGLSVAELDPAWWWLPGADAVSIPVEADTEEVFRYDERELFRIADAVGARSLNAVDVFGGAWSTDDAAEAFAGLCDRAAEHGLLVHVEFLPWSRIPDLATAWDIVRLADRPNGGLAVDAWHYFRAGAEEMTLRSIPGDRVIGIQLDDGPARAEANLIDATLHERLLPGDGDFDLPGLLGILGEIGCTAPLGVEVFSDALHELAPAEAARRAGQATRHLLDSLA